jgi:protein-disulfide isomerase
MDELQQPVEKNDHIRGNTDAPLTLVEYGDFECPHCGHAYGYLPGIREAMGDSLRFVYREFPLSEIHPYAKSAAAAAEAAGLQGKFWQMHDLLFTHQDSLTDADLLGYAQELFLDIGAFREDMISDTVAKKIHEDFLGGIASGVNGTPTFFINSMRYNGPNEAESLLEALRQAQGGHLWL